MVHAIRSATRVLLPAFTAALPAQIPIGGALSGTLAAGVYHATSNLSVATGQTLVLSAGVIIKFNGQQFTVAGTLLANGTAANPVVLTHIQDDSAGGDTNGNGPSVGTPGGWVTLRLDDTADASVLDYTEVRFGGHNFTANAELFACDATFRHCRFANGYSQGIDLNETSRPTVTDCTFTGNGAVAVERAPITALPGFAGNNATGNAGGTGNYVQVTDGDVAADLTIGPGAMISGAIVVAATIDVAAGATLTIDAGTILKFAGVYNVHVIGTLRANGTAADPVILTHIQDDSAGGDTNGNGPSAGTPGGSSGLRLEDTADASVLDYTEVRFGGYNFTANAELFACDATFRHCRFANGYSQGIDLNETSRPTVTDCTFANNGAVAVERAAITALPGFAGNNATGNAGGTGNYVQVTDGDVTADLTIGPGAMISGAIVVAATIDVAAGATLTIAAGTILKFAGVYNVHVIGTLRATGTAADPVILTHIQDDSAGGDTNGNGPSAGTPGSWSGLRLEDTADASVLDHTEVRYGGYNFVANAELFACDATFRHCRFANGYSQGIDLNETSRPTVTDCTFAGNGAVAIERAAIAAIPGFANNTATGNGGNYVDITEAVVSGSLRIGPQAVMNGALVLSTNLTVPAGAVLTIEQGVTFKFASVQSVVVDGAVWFLGTSYEPIVFTALADDQYGGDTNGNGASSGAPSSWVRVWLRNGTSVSRLENVVVRYAGYNYAPGLDCESPFVALVAVRVDRCYARGFELDIVAGNPTNLVAWANGSDGIWVGNGRFDLRHATAAGNATGIRRGTRWTGTVVNSISWGNSVNFASFTAPQVFYSDGFAGGSGNLNVDPQFVDLAGGDLHLAAGSPCLDVASLGYGVSATKDFDENSRVTDQSLTGLSLPDMGAFERQVWDMTVAGTPRPGATVTFQVDGPPGLSFWCWGTLDATLPFLPYGIVLVGIPGQSLVLLLPYPVTTATPVPLPLVNDPSLIGAIAGFQTLTFPAASAAYGNLTRLYRGLVRP